MESNKTLLLQITPFPNFSTSILKDNIFGAKNLTRVLNDNLFGAKRLFPTDVLLFHDLSATLRKWRFAKEPDGK
jgi:hypothetical protein